MATTLKDFKALPRNIEAFGVQPIIQPGDVYWVANKYLENRVFRFRDCNEGSLHPVVIVDVERSYAEVRIMTSKFKGNRHNGIHYHPSHEVRLNRPGLILTSRVYHRYLPVIVLRQENFLGNVGLLALTAIWVSEWLLDGRNGSSSQPLQ